MLSAIPIEARAAAIGIVAALATAVVICVWRARRRDWGGAFAALWLGVAAVVVCAVVLGMPYANGRLRLQCDGPCLNELGPIDGRLATLGAVPDFFRYYSPTAMRPLADASEAAAFLASSDRAYCLLPAQDLSGLERAVLSPLIVLARYDAQDRHYLLVTQRVGTSR